MCNMVLNRNTQIGRGLKVIKSIYPEVRTVTMEQVRAVADDRKKRERAYGRPLNKVFTRQRY